MKEEGKGEWEREREREREREIDMFIHPSHPCSRLIMCTFTPAIDYSFGGEQMYTLGKYSVHKPYPIL